MRAYLRTTVRLIGAVRVSPPPVPVMVSGNVPVVALPIVVIVSVDEFVAAGFGLNDPLAPFANPLSDSVTPPVNPPLRVIDTVYVVL